MIDTCGVLGLFRGILFRGNKSVCKDVKLGEDATIKTGSKIFQIPIGVW
jgi:hypothetical protein